MSRDTLTRCPHLCPPGETVTRVSLEVVLTWAGQGAGAECSPRRVLLVGQGERRSSLTCPGEGRGGLPGWFLVLEKALSQAPDAISANLLSTFLLLLPLLSHSFLSPSISLFFPLSFPWLLCPLNTSCSSLSHLLLVLSGSIPLTCPTDSPLPCLFSPPGAPWSSWQEVISDNAGTQAVFSPECPFPPED